MSDELTPTAQETMARIRALVTEARRGVISYANVAMLQAHWNIGRENRGGGAAGQPTRRLRNAAS